MTKRIDKTHNGSADLPVVSASGLDPRLVELVRFMARRAAEYDFKAMLEAAEKNRDLIPERKKLE